MTYILAISGGVDSVVLLDMFSKNFNPENLIVAHFEHGIRGEASEDDAVFVEKLSQKYRVKFEIGYGNLSNDASEEAARNKRYEFLKATAKNHRGVLVTAHHQDDLIETIAINLARGTGWRGLAVFGDVAIHRPLAKVRKAAIYDYAMKNNLEWVEDETNSTERYLRNRIRKRLTSLLTDENRKKLLELYERQTVLRREIEQEQHRINEGYGQSRYFFIMLPEAVALEPLRSLTGAQLTRPQLKMMLLAIKTYSVGSTYQAGSGISVSFTKSRFIVTNTSRML